MTPNWKENIMQAPNVGRIVQYKISIQDAEAINRRRQDAGVRRRTAAVTPTGERPVGPGWVEHTGNDVRAGDVFPLVITRVWAGDTPRVNGQVLLDGNDTFWATSVSEGDGERQYVWLERT